SEHMNPGRIEKVISKLNRAPAASTGGDTRVGHTQTGADPSSAAASCHSAPEWLGTWTTRRRCVQPPSVEQDTYAPISVWALHLCAECARYSPAAPGHAGQWEIGRASCRERVEM